MYDKYNEDGFLIIHGCPNFTSLSIEQCNPNFNVESFTEVLALQAIRCPLKYQFSCGKENLKNGNGLRRLFWSNEPKCFEHMESFKVVNANSSWAREVKSIVFHNL